MFEVSIILCHVEVRLDLQQSALTHQTEPRRATFPHNHVCAIYEVLININIQQCTCSSSVAQ